MLGKKKGRTIKGEGGSGDSGLFRSPWRVCWGWGSVGDEWEEGEENEWGCDGGKETLGGGGKG